MAKKKIQVSVPVFLSDLQAHETNPSLSTCKLKIFYEGTTADGRTFTSEFSEKLLKTLPSTPIVAFFDEEAQDFIGHNDVQYSYGHVPESPNVTRLEEDGKQFSVTDVILYTGRQDNIGEVANKIVGHPHSLELDPESLEYVINRYEDGTFKDLEFIDGNFIGLSVLGFDQQPAFEGSAFFTQMSDNIQSYMEFKFKNNFVEVEEKEEVAVAVVDEESVEVPAEEPIQMSVNNEPQEEEPKTTPINDAEPNTAALLDEERAELEEFRNSKKESIISEFEDLVEEQVIERVRRTMVTTTWQEIEEVLSVEYSRQARFNAKQKAQRVMKTMEPKKPTPKVFDEYDINAIMAEKN